MSTFFGRSSQSHKIRFTEGHIFDQSLVRRIRTEFIRLKGRLRPSSFPYMHAIENALGMIDTYLEERYSGKMPTTHSGAALSFYINMKNIDPKDWSLNGLYRLRMAEIYKGDFPFSLEFYSKIIPNYQRISNFYRQVRIGSHSQDFENFILDRIVTSYSSIGKIMRLNIHSSSTGVPILNVRSTSVGIPQPILDLIKLADDFNSAYLLGTVKDKERADNKWGHPSHSGIANEVRRKLSPYLVTSELPLWKKSGARLLTGHLDILLKIGDTLFVCDYKPDGIGNPKTTKQSYSFLQSVPQVAAYAKVLKKRYGIRKVVCVTFNHKNEAWIYHDDLLGDLEAYMINMGFSQYIIWRGYI